MISTIRIITRVRFELRFVSEPEHELRLEIWPSGNLGY